MPYSSPIFESEVELYFREVRPSSVLEIGAVHRRKRVGLLDTRGGRHLE
jgi:hypothetical protein